MQAERDDDFWEDLLDFIERGRVIPVVGEGAVTFGPDNSPLYPWLALRLADRLPVARDKLPATPTVNDVVCTRLIDGGDRDAVYTRIHRILRDECPPPGDTLRHLAGITDFKLYLTTTVDPLLQRALEEARAGQLAPQVCAFFPGSDKMDLPARRADLTRPTVYHVLGKASNTPFQFVAWDEDVLEFICALQLHIAKGDMDRLARDLKEHGLLMLGLNFSDWLVRFFLRVAKQSRLSEGRPHTEYLAEGPPEALSKAMVLYFNRATRNVHVVPMQAAEFVAELARRWRMRHPAPAPALGAPGSPNVPSSEMPRGAIFISYAREDEEAVLNLKAGLEDAGCIVWYDRERLKPGVHYHNTLADEVQGRCALFLSVISRTTEDTPSAYYHQERNWAQEYYGMFAQGRVMDEYYIPVLIDDSPLPAQREPRAFAKIQATLLPGGIVTPVFACHMRALQIKRTAVLFPTPASS